MYLKNTVNIGGKIIMNIKTCSFTGHRPNRFSFGYDEEHPDCFKLKLLLEQEVLKLIKRGWTRFLCGMALGSDIFSAEIVLDLKRQGFEIELVCVIPCKGQADNWNDQYKKRYKNILKRANEIKYISNEYTNDCMHKRNRYLVDTADIILAVYDGETKGGTAYTVSYARIIGKEVIIIKPN